jgi:hypothetical protein
MCWYIEFNVMMSSKQNDPIDNVEKIIEGFKIKPERRSLREVTLVKGSIAEGYRTALHCDCDNVKSKKDSEGERVQLLHYPDLFKIIIEQPRVKNIQVHWYWNKDDEKLKGENISISEFLKQHDAFELRSGISYKILKDKYY